MPVRITSRHSDLSETFQNLVTTKAQKLKKYFDKVDQIDVIFTTEKHRKICEIIVHAGPLSATGKAENGDEAPAFEKALKVCERQIKEQKEKMVHRRKKVVNPSKGTNRSGKPIRHPVADTAT
jgi:putative sigma-54 modulation protein